MTHLTRRMLLGTAATATAAFAALPAWAQASIVPTPRATEGPFYPRSFPLDVDADLVQVVGQSGRARGTIVYLAGKLLTQDGRPIGGAQIEIWQCDASGTYHHVGESSRAADPNFQGYGKTRTAADGAFRFRTIKPVPYPGRTPHIHFKIKRGDRDLLVTQCYIKGDPKNADDGVLRGIADARARDSVMVDFVPIPGDRSGALSARFDIVLGVTPSE